ncbi:ATP-dependent DNA helicase RecQ [Kineosphaera limosa]|nr:ATP-dependent DNA helicase RecQ [Kineosphaera limosa]
MMGSQIDGQKQVLDESQNSNLSPQLPEAERERAQVVLHALAGPGARLRADQERAVAALLLPAARVLVVQATGWGKSAVYWVATALRRAQGAGPTLVVSPLLALMRDQVAAAQRAGLRAVTVNSGNVEQWSAIEEALRADEVDVLLVSPERLANPGFGRRVLQHLAGRLGLLVVDEAHAVSDWGHDFRPDYRRVADVLRDLNPQTPVLATTATANARVTADVAAQLGQTLVLRGPLSRASLSLAVVEPMAPLDRYAWVAEHLPRLPGSGIIYMLTVADTARLVEAIRAVHGDELPVAAYSGQLPVDEREALEDALRANRLKALVATSALGMGYDKPDLGFVVHVGSPPSPVAYYQQVGRAGRAIDHAAVAVLPSGADAGVWDYYATSTLPDEGQCRRLLEALAGQEQPQSVVVLEAQTGLRRGRVELLLKQLAVERVVSRETDGWVATGVQWTYDAAHYEGILAGRRREAAIMTDYLAGRSCLMELLALALDDPDAGPCGRCSVCTGGLPQGWTQRPGAATVATVGAVLRGQHTVLEPRRMWPGGRSGLRGRIAAGEAAQEGRVLVHADAPEWLQVRQGALTRDAPPPAELLDAAVNALVAWRGQWPQRPEVVVDLAAAGLSQVAAGVADHCATVGRLERASWPAPEGAAGVEADRELAGPDQVARWLEVLAPPQRLVEVVAGRTVLLVVDATVSGWPVTIAARALRRAGAGDILPLLVHRRV